LVITLGNKVTRENLLVGSLFLTIISGGPRGPYFIEVLVGRKEVPQ
jgi:hypothetical protein